MHPFAAFKDTISLTNFGSPFNEDDSDIVLRSSTGVNFQVYKGPLRMASPFFRQLLSLPQGDKPPAEMSSDECYKGLPCICMPEDTQTLHRLLSFIFPVRLVMPNNVKEAVQVLSAMQKYEIKEKATLLRKLL
ncbi:hypothetical protein K488DRAFT_44620, partial [Vararia minispora EC-137]